MKIKAILFDLGKVLVHFEFAPAYRRFERATGIPADRIKNYFLTSGIEVLYDGGKITSMEFYRQVKKELGHKLTFTQFKKLWNEIFTPNRPVVNLLQRLKRRYRLVLISNTNAMHYEYIRKKYSFMKCFNAVILSYKEKIRKPDERIYRKAAKACRARPQEILYIDDRSDLIEAAVRMGFCVFTYQNNPKSLFKTMKWLGILPVRAR
jgi:putative hydrolase of the HAD superfamily